MTQIVELVSRPGQYVIVSETGSMIGYISGSDTDWRWSVNGADEVEETSLPRAKAAALKQLADAGVRSASPGFQDDLADRIG